ncbi:unnamed protein product [Rotaria socialis]|uniref:Uncharacterized protein n=1 Tax=Rotaria socialis TaxID=392032 RepID=A0A818VU89_9BILA|nr:unnamed protein product [Rotaria socialis]
MTEDNRVNNHITVENARAVSDPHVENERHENATQKQSDPSTVFAPINKKINKSKITATSLDKTCWSKHGTSIAAGAFVVFTIIAIIIGVLTISFTSPNPTVQKCELKLKETPQHPIDYKYGPRSVAVGDFNNDSWPDMVIANRVVNSIAIYIGQNGTSFSTPIQYSTGNGSTPYMVTVGDFNNNHILDIAEANFGTNSIGIFLGIGNGSFEKRVELSMGSSRPIAISLSDMNNDTILDIITANYGTQSISILFGYGNGNFSSPTSYSTGYDSFPSAVATGDFNNDNYLDLSISNYGTDSAQILFGNKNGTFKNGLTLLTSVGSRPNSIAVGHFNQDVYQDIAVANSGSNEIGIFLNNGNGTFAKQVAYSTNSSSPYSIGVGDFNQDNLLDIIVSNNGTKNIAFFLGCGNGTFVLPRMYSTGAFSSISFAICDVNKDRRLDIMVVSNDTGAIDILLGSFEGFENQMTFSTGSYPQSVAVGFENQMTFSTGSVPKSVAVGDFNNDTQLDIVVANSHDKNVSVLLGYRNGSFQNQMTFSTGFGPQSVAVGDFNNDTRLDIVVDNFYSNNVSILLQ